MSAGRTRHQPDGADQCPLLRMTEFCRDGPLRNLPGVASLRLRQTTRACGHGVCRAPSSTSESGSFRGSRPAKQVLSSPADRTLSMACSITLQLTLSTSRIFGVRRPGHGRRHRRLARTCARYAGDARCRSTSTLTDLSIPGPAGEIPAQHYRPSGGGATPLLIFTTVAAGRSGTWTPMTRCAG